MSEAKALQCVVDSLIEVLDRYDPNQPRDPGGEDGGQWVKAEAGDATPAAEVSRAKHAIDVWEKDVNSSADPAIGEKYAKETDPYRRLFRQYVERFRQGLGKLAKAIKAGDSEALRASLGKVNADLAEFRGLRDALNLTTWADWQEHEATFRTYLQLVGRAT